MFKYWLINWRLLNIRWRIDPAAMTVWRQQLWDPLRTCAIPERLRGAFTTRRYTNPRLPLPLPLLHRSTSKVKWCKWWSCLWWSSRDQHATTTPDQHKQAQCHSTLHQLTWQGASTSCPSCSNYIGFQSANVCNSRSPCWCTRHCTTSCLRIWRKIATLSVTGRRQLRSSDIRHVLSAASHHTSWWSLIPCCWTSRMEQSANPAVRVGQFRGALKTHLFGHWQLQHRMTVYLCTVYKFAYLLTQQPGAVADWWYGWPMTLASLCLSQRRTFWTHLRVTNSCFLWTWWSLHFTSCLMQHILF